LPSEIIHDARTMVAPDDLKAESLLDEIHRQRDAAREARAQAEMSRDEARALQAELSRRLESIEDERRSALEVARSEAAAEVEAVRSELAALRRRLASAAQPLEALKEIARDVEALEERVEEPVARASPEASQSSREFRLGDRVRLRTLGTDGILTAISSDQAEVQIGRLRVRARLEELAVPVPATDAPGTKKRRRVLAAPPGGQPATFASAVAAAPPLELDLRGRMVDEALEELDRRLDAAYLAGLPWVRVIHGKGTGRLRQAIRQALKGYPHVASFETGAEGEGGEGVTVVRLVSG